MLVPYTFAHSMFDTYMRGGCITLGITSASIETSSVLASGAKRLAVENSLWSLLLFSFGLECMLAGMLLRTCVGVRRV